MTTRIINVTPITLEEYTLLMDELSPNRHRKGSRYFCKKGKFIYKNLDGLILCKFCNELCHYKITDKQIHPYCPHCYKRRKLLKRNSHRLECMMYMGDIKCSMCGDADFDNLQFHHPNQSTKKFAIGRSDYKLNTTLKAELDKCILVCISCHNKCHENGTQSKYANATKNVTVAQNGCLR